MTVAALYDVHAMPWALEAVLEEAAGADAIVIGGDFLGGPCPEETVEQVNQLLEARKQMEKMMKQMGRGKMPGLPTPQAPQQSLSAGRKTGVKRKKKARR